ncbi:MAG: hypothetical protein PHG66_00625 [Candidatus Colwellbacteria bacterium]|nr:hypothetical protein [Candidatus Colwellbacteria bacterium]
MSLEKAIEHLNSKSIDNYIPVHFTYLNWAVKENNLRVIDTLLKKGINPNGISSIGVSKSIPLTVIDFKSSDFQTIVRMLLKHGANINGEDLEGHTIFTKCILFFLEKERYQNAQFFDLFTFLLERGANPDGTLFCNPLQMIVQSLNSIPRDDRDIIFYLSELLLAYNANPKSLIIKFHQFAPNVRTNAVLTLDMYSKASAEFKIFNKLFNINVLEVVTDCKSDIILESLAKYYKIPYDGSDKARKELCKCVKNISSKKDKYSEDEFVSIRSRIRKIQGKKECSNEDLLIGASIDSFPESELIYLDETKPDIRYCFHVSEIPMLLSSQKNPFNNKPLTDKFIDELVTKHKYFVPKTLEESLDDMFIFKDTRLDSGTLLDKLSDYVKTFNTYMQPEKIKDIEINDMVEIQNMIYQGNRDLITISTLPTDRVAILGENPDRTKKRILDRTLTHIFLYLKKNDGSLPLISNIIDQLLKDTFLATDILSLFPAEYKLHIQGHIKILASYDIFKRDFSHIINNARYIDLIPNDRKFLNSLSDDQRATIAFISENDVLTLYKNYVLSSIETLLKTRFGDISLNAAWNDIVPALIRS